MKKEDELSIKVTKEIVVKFIEVGRLTVNSFEEVWNNIHKTVRSSLKEDDAKRLNTLLSLKTKTLGGALHRLTAVLQIYNLFEPFRTDFTETCLYHRSHNVSHHMPEKAVRLNNNTHNPMFRLIDFRRQDRSDRVGVSAS